MIEGLEFSLFPPGRLSRVGRADNGLKSNPVGTVLLSVDEIRASGPIWPAFFSQVP